MKMVDKIQEQKEALQRELRIQILLASALKQRESYRITKLENSQKVKSL
jgi:hypothetical protein